MGKKDFEKKPITKKNPEDGESSSRKFLTRKILYLDIDDEVTSVFDRMKSIKATDVFLVIPKQAIIVQSLVNLKILKSHADTTGKSIAIITNDPNGIHLAKRAGLTVYDHIDQRGKPYLARLPESEEMSISPLKASVNAVEEDAPTRLKEPKLSIVEFLGRMRKNKGSIITEIANIKKKKTEMKQSKEPRLVLVAPNKQALISLVVVSVLILLAIAYIALPGSTIYLTPKASTLEQSVNIVFADFESNTSALDSHTPNMLASHPLEVTIKRTFMYNSTGTIFEGENAKGVLTIQNESANVWPLIPKTRFQTDDGLVYRVQDYANVPAGAVGAPGTLDVEVLADPFDAYGQAIGERGNIGPTRFFLPGLSAEKQKTLYATSAGSMSGGKTNIRKKVSKEDLERAKTKMGEDLKKAIPEELEKAVTEKNSLLNIKSKFHALEGNLAVNIGEPKVVIASGLEGQEIVQFEVGGELSVDTVYYNEDEVYDLLASQLKLKKSPLKKIVKIDRESIGFRIFDVDKNTRQIKVTATIKGIEVFDLSTQREYGERLVEKIKEHVVGRKIEDAKDYIRNLAEVKAVEIKSWPAWAPTLPSVPDNIRVEIVNDL